MPHHAHRGLARARRRAALLSLAGCLLPWLASGQAAAFEGATGLDRALELMHATRTLACSADTISERNSLGRRLPGVSVSASRDEIHPMVAGIRRVFDLPEGRLAIDWLAPQGELENIRLQIDAAAGRQPLLYVMLDGHCRVQTARRIDYDAEGRPREILHLNGTLAPTGQVELIDPPIPVHADPGGIAVALIDTGVNYTLPTIGARLARAADGSLLGYDYWDLDDAPFDANPGRSPFFPGRHGTAVASLVVAEAPVARLVPYRFPRPDMRRLGDLIDAAADQGIRLANMSLASLRAADWQAFNDAVARHPEMLFVVAAGNHGRDIDRQPVFPAAVKQPNLIAVTAGTAKGELVKQANWGQVSVDLMAPADQIPVLDFDGIARRVTGSSYATARVTALAACLLAAYPARDIAAIKAAIFALAVPPAEPARVAQGFIPDAIFGQRGACASQPPDSAI